MALTRRTGSRYLTCLILFLGIVPSIAFYSAVYGPIRHPLSYPDGDRIFSFLEFGPLGSGVSIGDIDQMERQAPGVEAIGAFRARKTFLLGQRGLDQVTGLEVRPEFFKVLGIVPVIGRLPGEDDFAISASPVALISEATWKSRFGSSPNIIGGTVIIGGKRTQIVGVVNAGSTFNDVQIWFPAPFPRQADQLWEKSFEAIGKLAPGVTLPLARAQVESIFRQLQLTSPSTHRDWWPRITLLQDDLSERAGRQGMVLLAVGAAMYLLSLANAAMHAVARANADERAVAVRLALGLEKNRAARQHVVSYLIEGAASTTGAALTFLALRSWLLTQMPAQFSSLDQEIRWPELMVLLLACISITTLGVSVLPLVWLRRLDPFVVLQRRSERATAEGKTRWNKLLIALQCVVAMVLLIFAGLLGRSEWNIEHHELGFDGDGAMLAQLAAISDEEQGSAPLASAYRTALDRLRADRRLQYVGLSSDFPLGGTDDHVISCAGTQSVLCKDSIYATVSGQFLEALGLKAASGRLFIPSDEASSAPVAVISRTAEASLFPGGSAIGKDLKIAGRIRTVVGVIPDAARRGIVAYKATGIAQVYVLDSQDDSALGAPKVLAIRSKLSAADAAEAVQSDLMGVLAGVKITNLQSLASIVDAIGSPSRRLATLLVICVLFSSAITLTGIYSMALLAVQTEKKEAGVRLALGAPVGDVLFRILRPMLAAFATGVALGMVVAYALVRVMNSLLYGVSETDLVVFVASPISFLLAAVLISLLPTFRIVHIELPTLLRSE